MQKRHLEIRCDNIDKHRQWIFPAVFNYLIDQPFDVTFKIGESLIPAHKQILSAVSPFFVKMFKDQEVHDSESYIRLEGVNCDCFHVVLDLIYNGHVNIIEEEIAEVIKTAEKLEIGFFCPAIPEPPEESDQEEQVDIDESNNLFFSEEVDQQDDTNVILKHDLSGQTMENSDKENSELVVSRKIESRQRYKSSSVIKCEPLNAIESRVKEEVNEDLRCRHCSKVLATDKNLIRHEKVCKFKFKSGLECSVCSMQFDLQEDMHEHIRWQH